MTHCFSPNAAAHGNPSWPGGLVQACCGTTKAGRILRRFPSNPFFAAAELFASLIKVATKPLRPTLRSATQFLIPNKRMGAGCQLASRTSRAHNWNDRSVAQTGRASRRVRVGKYVEISVGALYIKKNTSNYKLNITE